MAKIDPVKLAKAEALNRIIEAIGGTNELSRRLGISSQAVSQWDAVPAFRVLAVERACDYVVPRWEIDQELYPPEDYAHKEAHDRSRQRNAR